MAIGGQSAGSLQLLNITLFAKSGFVDVFVFYELQKFYQLYMFEFLIVLVQCYQIKIPGICSFCTGLTHNGTSWSQNGNLCWWGVQLRIHGIQSPTRITLKQILSYLSCVKVKKGLKYTRKYTICKQWHCEFSALKYLCLSKQPPIFQKLISGVSFKVNH